MAVAAVGADQAFINGGPGAAEVTGLNSQVDT
jgi:hypothetical protein